MEKNTVKVKLKGGTGQAFSKKSLSKKSPAFGGTAGSDKGPARFKMVKERHRETMEKAVCEGKADEKMLPLLEFIAGTKNFFTSSSCSGRILLLGLPKGEDKKEAYFHRRWHRKAKEKEFLGAMKEETRGELWLKQEPFILHVGAKTIEGCRKVLGAMHSAGVKRGGIISAKEGKFVVELQGTQGMHIPLKKGKKLLVEGEYLDFLLGKANEKLEKNFIALKRLEKEFRKALK